MKQRIVVIGSGFGGLSAAARLAAGGHQVTLLERMDQLGGRGVVFERDGYRFDAGPTIITAPWLFDEIWAKAGYRREDDVEFVKMDPFYRIFNAAGERFDYNDDDAFTLAEIERLSPRDVDGYQRFLASTKPIFDKGFSELADVPFLRLRDMFKVAPDLLRLRSDQSVYKYVSRFIEHEFLRQCFSFHPLLIGGNPFRASSIYAMIHYLERKWGVWYAMGGTGALVAAYAKLLGRLGVEIVTDASVERIEVATGPSGRARAEGVRTADGRRFEADVVVSNADVGTTYTKMIDPAFRFWNRDARYRATRFGMSAVVLYFGTDRLYRDTGLAHHNIILGPRYKGLIDDLFFNNGSVPKDFSIYLHVPTMTDPSVAPAGHEAFYALSPVPNLKSGIDWERHAKGYRDAIMRQLEATYLPGLSEHLVTETMVDPRFYRDAQQATHGSAFSVEPLLWQSAWFRPHNRSEDIENLYIVGAGTHPGAGMPGVVSSAKIADTLIGPA
jgi:phytoene desaturase